MENKQKEDIAAIDGTQEKMESSSNKKLPGLQDSHVCEASIQQENNASDTRTHLLSEDESFIEKVESSSNKKLHDIPGLQDSDVREASIQQENYESRKHLLSDDACVILKYPETKGIEITKRDVRCLEPKQFLNDTIIDFYLNYFYDEKLSPQLQERTHVFNCFFFTKLLKAYQKEKKEKKPIVLSNALKDIQRWLKNIDIFQKDFIFIPVNILEHWYMIVICFINKLTEENTLKPSVSLPDHSASSQKKDHLLKPAYVELYPEKRAPLIIFFDSNDASRELTRCKKGIALMVKSFFKILWEENNNSSFHEENLTAVKAMTPLQTNKYDCGLYMLQVFEKFFTNPITSFEEPLPDLTNWFDLECISEMRSIIQNIIHLYSVKQNITECKKGRK